MASDILREELARKPHRPSAHDYRRAVSFLAEGGIVALPTETFYGLAVDPFNERALEALFRLKGRERGKPFPVLIHHEGQLPALVQGVPDLYRPLMKAFWPGPLTLVFPAKAGLSSLLTGKDGGVGIRISPHPVAERLGQLWGRPITATSANPSGLPAARTAEEVRRFFGDKVDFILDGGPTAGGKSSTVVSLHGNGLCLLRAGVIEFSRLTQVLNGSPSRGQDLVVPRQVLRDRDGMGMDDLRWNKGFAMEQVDHDEELLAELLTIFRDSSASDLTMLKGAVERADHLAAGRAAHSLKGAAASLGLEAIRDLSLAMERECREGSLTMTREKLPLLESLLALAREVSVK